MLQLLIFLLVIIPCLMTILILFKKFWRKATLEEKDIRINEKIEESSFNSKEAKKVKKFDVKKIKQDQKDIDQFLNL